MPSLKIMDNKQNDPTWKATSPNNIPKLAMSNLASKNKSPTPMIKRKKKRKRLKQNSVF